MNFFAKHNDTLTQEAIDQGVLYIRITLFAVAFNGVRDVIIRAMRVEGKNLSSAIIPIIALPINLAFDIIFMHPKILGMGLGGAGLATVIGAFVGAAIAVIYAFILSTKDNTYISFGYRKMIPT